MERIRDINSTAEQIPGIHSIVRGLFLLDGFIDDLVANGLIDDYKESLSQFREDLINVRALEQLEIFYEANIIDISVITLVNNQLLPNTQKYRELVVVVVQRLLQILTVDLEQKPTMTLFFFERVINAIKLLESLRSEEDS
ncbi:MAG: hypothetical protein ABI721_00800 [Candidatus Dojkabacteria bacterium]